MFHLPLWSAFADAAADPRFAYALGIATLAGLVRGFSGFGSALIYMPLISAIYSPAVAAPSDVRNTEAVAGPVGRVVSRG